MRNGKYSIRFVLALAALCCVRPAGMGQSLSLPPSEVLSMDRALELALQNNRQVRNASLDILKDQERAFAARTLWWPTFDLNVQGLQQLRPIDFVFERGVFGVDPIIGPIPATNTKVVSPARPTGILDFRVSQKLSGLYRVNLQTRVVRLNKEFDEERLRAKEHEISRSVKQLYKSILMTESGLQNAAQNVGRYRELERETDEYLAQGEVLRSDSLEVKLQLARAEDEQIALSDHLAVQKQQLNQLLGRDILSDFDLIPIQDDGVDDVPLAMLRTQAVAHRPELREARLRVEQAMLDRSVKKSEFIPDARVAGQYLATRNFNEIIPANVLAIGISLDWDVFDWGRKKHELNEKTLTIQQLKNDSSEAESAVLVDVDTKYRNLQRARQRLRIAELSREVAEEKARVIAARYEVQASLLKDVLQQQAALSEATHQYQTALSELWIAKAELDNAVGQDK